MATRDRQIPVAGEITWLKTTTKTAMARVCPGENILTKEKDGELL